MGRALCRRGCCWISAEFELAVATIVGRTELSVRNPSSAAYIPENSTRRRRETLHWSSSSASSETDVQESKPARA